LLESIYAGALEIELCSTGLTVEKELPVRVYYKGNDLGFGFRFDLLVEDQVVVEMKSVESLHNVHKKQLISYLKISGKKVGILVNFNVDFLQDKISLVRLVN
jgi:GxxExxY protein